MKHNRILAVVLMTALTACTSGKRDYDATGTFETTEVTVSAEESGKLLWFNVEEGKNIVEGAQVGLIDTVQLTLTACQLGATRSSIAHQRPDIRKQIAATKQQLLKAKQEQRRFRGLVKDEAANRKLLDDATSSVLVLKRQLAAQISSLDNSTQTLNAQISATDIQKYQVLDRLSKCHITSPITGTVLGKYVEPGEFAIIGKPLFKVADLKNVFLRAYITSAQLEKVKIGQQVTVMANYGNGRRKTYKGTVAWIADRAEFTPKTILTDDERADLVYAVKIAVANDGYIQIGMYGEVRF